MVRIKYLFNEEKSSYTKKKGDIDLPTPKPIQIYWDITYKCPLDCEQCYARPSREVGEELDTEEVKELIDYFDSHGINILTFVGGEPLVREDIEEIITYADDKGFNISLITRGLYSDTIRKLKDKIDRIQMGLDYLSKGAKEEKASFLESAELVNEKGIRTSLCTTLMSKNYEEIPRIFDLAQDLGFDEYRLMRLVPSGSGKEHYRELSVSYEEYVELFKDLSRRYMETDSPGRIDVEEPYTLIQEIEDPEIKEMINYKSCLQGEAVCGITADGKIIPCPIANHEEFIGGDVMEDDLIEVWNNSKVFKHFRDVKEIDICNSCEFSEKCVGGCRCAAFGYYNKAKAPDPICPKTDHYGE